MRSIPLLLACCALTATGASAQRSHNNRDRSWDRITDTATWQWHGAVASGKTLRIRGIVGDITARAGRGSEAVVHAVKRARHRADTSDVQIHVDKSGDGVTICAVYPNQDARPDECPDGTGR
ncbi:MAG TPA: hypothetical protein VGI83_04925, partial [Gemmatimonadales bacterium]